MSKELFVKSGKRGRPAIVLNYPKTGKFTVSKLVELNPHVTCRLSIYTHAKKLVKQGVLRYTGNTIKTGGVGKPLDEFQSMAAYRQNRAKKAARRAAKLAKVTVDITPVVPVTTPVDPEPVTA